MELLEFKNKMLNLCGVDEVSQISNALLSVVLNYDVKFYEAFLKISNENKDWLQALFQYYEADRKEKKQDYTPKSLCNLVSAFADNSKTLYDCCGGSGALTLDVIKNSNIEKCCVEEIDPKVIPFLLFNLCLNNVSGRVYNKDVLTGEVFKGYEIKAGTNFSSCSELNVNDDTEKYDLAVSNPPFNLKWNPPTQIEAMIDETFPVIPPKGSANFAFVFKCLKRADKVIMILPNSIASEKSEKLMRQYLVDNDLVEGLIMNPDNMFENTSIGTSILILNKNKAYKGKIWFVDLRSKFVEVEREQRGQIGGASHTSRVYKKIYKEISPERIESVLLAIKEMKEIPDYFTIKENSDVASNGYSLRTSDYIPFDIQAEEEHRDYKAIVDDLNFIIENQNSCKLVINETLAKSLGFDIELYKKDHLQDTNILLEELGIKILKSDYIQFTKNKNEFVFKCNNKEMLPSCLLHFLSIWKNQIALLNTMENRYLTELQRALLPDLMSGKIELQGE